MRGTFHSCIVGSVVECSPATRAARVRFPDDANFLKSFFIKIPNINLKMRGIDPPTSQMLSEHRFKLGGILFSRLNSASYNLILILYHNRHNAFDSSVGRAVDCSCELSDIHRSLVQIRLEGSFVLVESVHDSTPFSSIAFLLDPEEISTEKNYGS